MRQIRDILSGRLNQPYKIPILRTGLGRRLVAFAVFGAIGLLTISASQAATFGAEAEAEAGSLSGNAGDGDPSGASGNKSVAFGVTASAAPSSGTKVCGQPILNSPYSYNGAAGTFTAANAPAGLPTFGSVGKDFPTMTKLVVIPAGNNKSAANNGSYEDVNTIFYFAPGTHIIDGMYAGHDSVYIGGYTAAAGKAILDGVDGTGGFGVSQASSGNNTHNTWMYLTVKNYSSSNNSSVMGNVNGGSWDVGDTYKYNTVGPNDYGYTGGTPATGKSSGGGYGIDLGDETTIQYNCLIQNAQGGFNGSGVNIDISYNEIVGNGLGAYPDVDGPGASPYACGCSGGGKLNFSTNPTLKGNYVHDNYNAGIWLDFDNTGADVSYNYIESNWGQGIFYEANYNANITYNTIKGNGWASNGAWPTGVNNLACYGGVSCTNGFGPVTGAGGGNPYAAIYIANSGGNANITAVKDESGTMHASRYSNQFTVKGNKLIDNFGGIDVYTDTDRFPDGINNDSACSVPLNGGSPTLYYRQTKFLKADNANVSGTSISTGAAHTLCSEYDTGAQTNGNDEQVNKTPLVGMGVFDLDAGTFLGNVASASSPTSFTLDRSPGNVSGADLLISAYGGCGPADYFGGGPGKQSGQPAAYYWDNCIWGGREVKVGGNTLAMDASKVTGCTTAANLCGFSRAAAFNAGVPKLVQYFQNYSDLTARASGGLGNVWSNNSYTWTGGGPGQWQFEAGLQGNKVSRSAWQAAPYGQDAGSTFQ